MPSALLNGLRVLIVEDETLVAMLMEELLEELGCKVACTATRVRKALEGLEGTSIEAAVLDVNVAGESVTPLVDALNKRQIPFIFASGYGAKGVDPRWADRPILQKPFTIEELEAALVGCLGGSSKAQGT
jgi:CheY-like chemotaxis protein